VFWNPHKQGLFQFLSSNSGVIVITRQARMETSDAPLPLYGSHVSSNCMSHKVVDISFQPKSLGIVGSMKVSCRARQSVARWDHLRRIQHTCHPVFGSLRDAYGLDICGTYRGLSLVAVPHFPQTAPILPASIYPLEPRKPLFNDTFPARANHR
jgi:hypothetical protein